MRPKALPVCLRECDASPISAPRTPACVQLHRSESQYVPVPLLALVGVTHFRAVPTADINLPIALALTVFIMIIYYNFKAKGAKNLLIEILSKPFGGLPSSTNMKVAANVPRAARARAG